MNFLADENPEYSSTAYLRAHNGDVLAGRDLMKGCTAAEIIKYALTNNRVIITNDKDFGELTFRLKKSNVGVILLRLPDSTHEEKTAILTAALKKIGEDVANQFIVIENNTLQIRSLL